MTIPPTTGGSRAVIGSMARLIDWLQHHHRAKAYVKALVGGCIALLPKSWAYRARAGVEKLAFNATPQVGELPPIFHYWSNRYLRPVLQHHGFESPDDFFFQEILERAQHADVEGRFLACASIAAGRCETEIEIARRLRLRGLANFRWTALDINASLLRQASEAAALAGVSDLMDFRVCDLNSAEPSARFDVIVANQCLHHLDNLESSLDFVRDSLASEGVLLTSDVIGRNGHMLWPEALSHVEEIWASMPESYRQDRSLGKVADRYVNYNHANVGFEGIRAQDILAILSERFSFQMFIGFGCIIFPFIDRRFGWNFDPENREDRDFIDRVALRDETLLRDGSVKPTQLLAKLCLRRDATRSAADESAASAWRDPSPRCRRCFLTSGQIAAIHRETGAGDVAGRG